MGIASRLCRMAADDHVTIVAENVDPAKLQQAAQRDLLWQAEYFVDNRNDDEKLIDWDENVVKDVRDVFFEEEVDNWDGDGSNVFDYFWEVADEHGVELTDAQLDEVVVKLGFTNIGELVSDKGYSGEVEDKIDKMLDSMADDLHEFMVDQNNQAKETEEMRYKSYTW